MVQTPKQQEAAKFLTAGPAEPNVPEFAPEEEFGF